MDGRNVRFNYRWTAGDARLVRRQTQIIPIVFASASDPVATGLLASLGHPDGDITGFTGFQYESNAKWLELPKTIAPDISRVAVMLNSDDLSWAGRWRAIEAAAPLLPVQLTKGDVHNDADIERTLDAFSGQPNGALIVLTSPFAIRSRGIILSLAAKHHLPAVYPQRIFAAIGRLASYEPARADSYKLAAGYVDRILRGEKESDLPVQAATRSEPVINLKTAKSLGLEIPPTLLAISDEVIE